MAFLFSALPALLLPHLFPSLKLFYFAPFLIIMLYKKPLLTALWWALGVGLLVDLLSGSGQFGPWAVGYTGALYLLSSLKRHFFDDSLSTLPLLTFFFSILLSFVMLFAIAPLFSLHYTLSKGSFFTTFLLYPMYDGLFALLWFTLPMQFLPRQTRRAYFI